MGETIDLVVTCGDDGVTEVPVTVSIDDIQVVKDDDHSTDIELADGYTVKMKYPSLSQFVETNFQDDEKNQVEKSFNIVNKSIDMVYNDEEMFCTSECTKKELKEWVESLTSEQFQKIEKFFDTMPKLKHTLKVTNPKTKKENTIELEGANGFFRLSMSHVDLETYFRINFALMQYHKYSLTEIENMPPWERDIYVGLLKLHIEEEN